MTTKTSTRQRLIDTGLPLLLQQGYNDLGLQELLDRAGVPRGSFYHHFGSKREFALQVMDHYMVEVHRGLDETLADTSKPPLERVRGFFEASGEKYRQEGYLGCLLGGLGQELSGINEVFREKVEQCFAEIAERLAECLEQARQAGDLPADSDPRAMADRLVDCWEGAALRSRLRRSAAPLGEMLDFCFSSMPMTHGH